MTNPLRCPDTNQIHVDGCIRFVYATCGGRYLCIRIKIFRIQKSLDMCGRDLKDVRAKFDFFLEILTLKNDELVMSEM